MESLGREKRKERRREGIRGERREGRERLGVVGTGQNKPQKERIPPKWKHTKNRSQMGKLTSGKLKESFGACTVEEVLFWGQACSGTL